MSLLADLDYTLPQELIAQHPLPRRDAARLLAINRGAGTYTDRDIGALGDYLHEGGVLVVNDSKVIPARLLGRKAATGASVEVLLLEECAVNVWEALVRPGRRVRPGDLLCFNRGAAELEAEVVGAGDGGLRRLRFHGEGNVGRLLDAIGAPPLPPYIKRAAPDAADRERYQTVYAREPGSVAAPTAGLHFTPALLAGLRERGINIVSVTLHVGLGTFQPLQETHLQSGRLHEERFRMSAETAHTLNAAKAAGRRIVAAGTTTMRVLESAWADNRAEPFSAVAERTSLFIRPGYRFRTADALLTNFHLPGSSLLALVSAFAGLHLIRRAYAHAIAERYRFYSYGDATLIC